jgi:cytochrome c oxidase assembly factor CtaG
VEQPVALSRRRSRRWPTVLVGAIALGAAALAVTAVVRSLTGDGPLLPYSLCRAGHPDEVLPPLTGSRILSSWLWNPLATILAVGAAILYATGLRRIGTTARQASWPAWRIGSFYAGLAATLVAVSSSVAVYDMTLFWAHMVQHLMLIMVAPVLIVMGRPLSLFVEASGEQPRRRMTRFMKSWPVAALTSPGVALAAYAAVIVGAHLTKLTDSFLSDVWAGQVEHLTYLVIGILFFWLIVGDEPIAWQLSMPGRILLLTVAMAVDTFVGVVLLETTKPLNTIPHPSWGPGPIADVQAGGAVMWVAGDGLMAIVAIAVYVAWARRPQETRKLSVFERARIGLQADRIAKENSIGDEVRASQSHENLDSDLDIDDRALEAYNRWLADLNRRG